MVTYYNRKDLIKFGEYLLSDERRESFERTESELSVDERLQMVHHADVENWIGLRTNDDKTITDNVQGEHIELV